MEHTFDVIIIGGGPGGVSAAKVLAEAGKKVALIEEQRLGGVCLNQGCIPTKFLLAASAPLGLLRDHSRFGSLRGEIEVDFAALQQRKERFVKASSLTLGKSLQTAGVSIIMGKANCVGPGRVAVSGKTTAMLCGADVILAAGSHAAAFPGLTPDNDAVLDSTMLLSLEEAPESLIIVGAGAIGIEFSDFFSSLGAQVTLVESSPRIIPTEDADIAEALAAILKKSGRTCMTGKKVASVVSREGRAILSFEDGGTLAAAKALIAVGRAPNTGGLGVEALGGRLNPRGFVAVNACLEAAPHAYAVGDINGLTLLAHAADHQGAWAARRILGCESGEYASGPVPSCIFGHVEVMRVGRTAGEVLAGGREVFVSTAPFSGNPIAQAHASSAGFAKAVWDGDSLAGMAAVGHGASHLVTAAQLLLLHGHTPASLNSFMFAHPTLDEILRGTLAAPRTPFKENPDQGNTEGNTD